MRIYRHTLFLFKSKHLIGNYLVYLECRNTFFIPLGVFSIVHINLILEQTAMAGTRWNSTVWEKYLFFPCFFFFQVISLQWDKTINNHLSWSCGRISSETKGGKKNCVWQNVFCSLHLQHEASCGVCAGPWKVNVAVLYKWKQIFGELLHRFFLFSFFLFFCLHHWACRLN